MILYKESNIYMKTASKILKPKKREYILHFIVKSSLNPEELHMYRTGVNEKILGMGGKVNASVCQEIARRLAYPIKKESQGYMCESAFLIEPKSIQGLSDALKQDVPLIRYVIEEKPKRKQVAQRRRRSERLTPPESRGREAMAPQGAPLPEKHEKISMEEINKKLDEIIKNI
jgi:ribosomal protein S6